MDMTTQLNRTATPWVIVMLHAPVYALSRRLCRAPLWHEHSMHVPLPHVRVSEATVVYADTTPTRPITRSVLA